MYDLGGGRRRGMLVGSELWFVSPHLDGGEMSCSSPPLWGGNILSPHFSRPWGGNFLCPPIGIFLGGKFFHGGKLQMGGKRHLWFGSIPFFSSEINSLEVGDSSQNLKKIFRITVSLWQSTSKIPDKSLPISNTNGSLKLIFKFWSTNYYYKLWNISFIGALVVEISYVCRFWLVAGACGGPVCVKYTIGL